MLTIVGLLFLSALLLLLSVAVAESSTLPFNWTTLYPCAVDTPSRIIYLEDVTTILANNTPAACIELCDADNFIYAGVEYGDECHCGTDIAVPQTAPADECDMPCSGDSDLTCGGSWLIQVYQSPALPPGGWSWEGCYVDTASSPGFIDPVHKTFGSNVDLISQCIDYCQHIGLRWSGVENGEDCQCSVGVANFAQLVDLSECNATCPLPRNSGNEYCGGFERLLTCEYQGP